MEIETNKSLYLENLLSLRKKMTQNEVNTELEKIVKFMVTNDINKNGPLVTTTFLTEK